MLLFSFNLSLIMKVLPLLKKLLFSVVMKVMSLLKKILFSVVLLYGLPGAFFFFLNVHLIPKPFLLFLEVLLDAFYVYQLLCQTFLFGLRFFKLLSSDENHKLLESIFLF